MYTDETNLSLLISLLSEERDRLQILIDQAISDHEYLSAHYHAEALEKVSLSLYKLRNIEDPLYSEKEFWKRTIELLKKDIASEGSSDMLEYYESSILNAREELEKLNQEVSQPSHNESSLFAAVLEQLLNKKVKNLKLFLNKTDKFYYSISYANKAVKVSMPGINALLNKRIISLYDLGKLRKIGFEYTLNETKLTLTINGKKEEILKQLNHLFAKIVFEVFQSSDFKEAAYLQFVDKTQS